MKKNEDKTDKKIKKPDALKDCIPKHNVENPQARARRHEAGILTFDEWKAELIQKRAETINTK